MFLTLAHASGNDVCNQILAAFTLQRQFSGSHIQMRDWESYPNARSSAFVWLTREDACVHPAASFSTTCHTLHAYAHTTDTSLSVRRNRNIHHMGCWAFPYANGIDSAQAESRNGFLKNRLPEKQERRRLRRPLLKFWSGDASLRPALYQPGSL